jgi:hypothetical protein
LRSEFRESILCKVSVFVTTSTHSINGLQIQNSFFVDEEAAGREEPFEAFTMTYFSDRSGSGFTGQFGVNRFTKSDGLMRHVHLSVDGQRFVRERILILESAILLDVGGEQIVIMPNTLCDIGPGVPHMWRGLPAGMLLPNGTRHSSESVMVFFYQEEVQGFERVHGPEILDVPAEVSSRAGDMPFPSVTESDVLDMPFIRNGQLQYREFRMAQAITQ